MHVHQHLPPPPDLRTQPRKASSGDEESGAYARVTDESGDNRRQGGRRQPRRQPAAAPAPTTSGLLKPLNLRTGAKPLQPFMAVTSVTEFWTELVMAAKPEDDGSLPVVTSKPPAGPSLLDLFAEAVK